MTLLTLRSAMLRLDAKFKATADGKVGLGLSLKATGLVLHATRATCRRRRTRWWL